MAARTVQRKTPSFHRRPPVDPVTHPQDKGAPMSNRIMLINGRHAEQLRVAVVEGGVLQLYDVEGTEATLKRGNIYRGVVANIERSLNAAFVEFGDAKHGFLTRHDVIPQAFHRDAGDSAPIDQILQKGQPIVVQVTRDAEGGKGATLTTNISLAGRFLVYFPYDAQRGVSRKVEDEALRRKLREKAKDLDLDEGEGVIVRTNAADQTKADLKADLQVLKRLWKAVVDDTAQGRGAKLLYDDQDLLIHSLRDNLDTQIDEVLIDDEQLLAKAEKYVQAVMPRAKVALKLYAESDAPLLPLQRRTPDRLDLQPHRRPARRRRHRHRPRRGADRHRRQLREVEGREEPGRHGQPHQPRGRGRGRQAAAAARHRRAGGRGLHRHALPLAPARRGEGPAGGDEGRTAPATRSGASARTAWWRSTASASGAPCSCGPAGSARPATVSAASSAPSCSA